MFDPCNFEYTGKNNTVQKYSNSTGKNKREVVFLHHRSNADMALVVCVTVFNELPPGGDKQWFLQKP